MWTVVFSLSQDTFLIHSSEPKPLFKCIRPSGKHVFVQIMIELVMLISVSRHLIHSSESIKPPFKSRLISIGYYPTVSAVLHNILSSSSTTTITSTIAITVTINALPLPNLCVHPTDGLNCFTLYSQELHYHFYYHYHCIATDFSITIHHY